MADVPDLGDRGDCEPPVPEVVGKYMRAKVVASLRSVAAAERDNAAGDEDDFEEGLGDDLSVCCHGRAAGPEVHYFISLVYHLITSCPLHASCIEAIPACPEASRLGCSCSFATLVTWTSDARIEAPTIAAATTVQGAFPNDVNFIELDFRISASRNNQRVGASD